MDNEDEVKINQYWFDKAHGIIDGNGWSWNVVLWSGDGGLVTEPHETQREPLTREQMNHRSIARSAMRAINRKAEAVRGRAWDDMMAGDNESDRDGRAYGRGLLRCAREGSQLIDDGYTYIPNIIERLMEIKPEAKSVDEPLYIPGYEAGIDILRKRLAEGV